MTFLAAASVCALVLASSTAYATDTQTWRFRVFLDETPIGEHRFELRGTGAERELRSHARFEVKVLGLTIYRYRHDAVERWRGDCLAGLEASTDDNGVRTKVTAQQEGSQLHIATAAGAGKPIEGCVMTFAYWNPRLLSQTRLLNPQTGEYESVRVSTLADETIVVHERELTAIRHRLTGATNPIDIWYSPQHEWIGLDSLVRGGRHLHYRLAS
ncbi:MAG: DUF6134 family protein [Pseudomonadota bacterium]|nr:DUF6134 family protein [Pseudomonadota bacterium]